MLHNKWFMLHSNNFWACFYTIKWIFLAKKNDCSEDWSESSKKVLNVNNCICSYKGITNYIALKRTYHVEVGSSKHKFCFASDQTSIANLHLLSSIIFLFCLKSFCCVVLNLLTLLPSIFLLFLCSFCSTTSTKILQFKTTSPLSYLA